MLNLLILIIAEKLNIAKKYTVLNVNLLVKECVLSVFVYAKT